MGTIGRAAWAAGVPAFLMTFNLLLLNEFPDEKADRAGGRLNLVLLLGRRRAALVYIAAAVGDPVVDRWRPSLAQWLPPLALIGCLPFWFAVPAVRWAATAAARARADPGDGRQRDLESRDEQSAGGGSRRWPRTWDGDLFRGAPGFPGLCEVEGGPAVI